MSHESQLGACLSDLVAQVHALSTEKETGHLLNVRVAEIKATTNSILQRVAAIQKERSEQDKTQLNWELCRHDILRRRCIECSKL